MTLQGLNKTETSFQRAMGHLSIVSKLRPCGASGLSDLRQSGSFKVVFPHNAKGRLEGVLVNTAGGVTGGDRFEVSARAAPRTQVCITTQAAERIYRAVDARAGRISTRLAVGDDATFSWLPQETILFDGCQLKRKLEVEVSAKGRFLMLEPLVFGREASGETLASCALHDSVSIYLQGQPIYLDRVRLSGDVTSTLQRPAVGGGVRALASLVLVADDAVALLPSVRAILPDTGGASLLGDRVLVVRLLSPDSYALRKTLLPILNLLTHDAVPKNWRL